MPENRYKADDPIRIKKEDDTHRAWVNMGYCSDRQLAAELNMTECQVIRLIDGHRARQIRTPKPPEMINEFRSEMCNISVNFMEEMNGEGDTAKLRQLNEQFLNLKKTMQG
jgi:hypothetical protein